MIESYIDVINQLLPSPTAENHGTAVELASLLEMVKSFGYVKEKAVAAMEMRKAELLVQFDRERLVGSNKSATLPAAALERSTAASYHCVSVKAPHSIRPQVRTLPR